MDRSLWKRIVKLIQRHARELPKLPKALFPDWLIVAMACWHTAHGKPMYWACDRGNYPAWFRPKKLPSPSQFTRRVQMPRFASLCQAIHEESAGIACPTGVSYLDGKPLVVGPASKDPDARSGHILGGFAKGFKLHVWATEDRRIPVFCVESLNRGEQPVAVAMTAHMPTFSNRALVLADSAYDSTALYNALAQKNAALLVKPRGFARHRVTRAQSGPYRREMLDVWLKAWPVARMVYKQRICVEGILSSLTSCRDGLGPLPAWVRRLPRVRRWVGLKIILYHMRLRVRKETKTGA